MHIGGTFTTTPILLNLMPCLKLPNGYWQTNISYMTDDNQFHQSTFMSDADGMRFLLGTDVKNISVQIMRHNSFPSGGNYMFQYNIRVDRLILLNMVEKLLNLQIDLEK